MNINKRSIKYVCYLFKRIKEKIYDRYFDDLNKRGLLDSYSDKEKIRELLKTPQTIYCGFDPSNKSMQLGNFIMIHILSKLQKAGHRIIAVVGGATGMIGDPSGKKSERSFLEPEQVNYNVECLKNSFQNIWTFLILIEVFVSIIMIGGQLQTFSLTYVILENDAYQLYVGKRNSQISFGSWNFIYRILIYDPSSW